VIERIVGEILSALRRTERQIEQYRTFSKPVAVASFGSEQQGTDIETDIVCAVSYLRGGNQRMLRTE